METAIKVIDVSSDTMDLFNEVIDQTVPWYTFETTLNELDRFRDDYSKKAAERVAEVRKYMSEGMTAYYLASKDVSDWCMVVEPMLQKYLDLFVDMDKEKSAQQNGVLVKMLDGGIKEMEEAQQKLGNSSSSFNGAAGRLTALRHQLTSDFNENSDHYADKIAQVRKEGYGISAIFGPLAWAIAAGVVEGELVPKLKAKFREARSFYQNLDGIVGKSVKSIEETKTKLNRESRAIGELKVQSEELNTYTSIDAVIELRDIVISSGENLINKCIAYRSKHKL